MFTHNGASMAFSYGVMRVGVTTRHITSRCSTSHAYNRNHVIASIHYSYVARTRMSFNRRGAGHAVSVAVQQKSYVMARQAAIDVTPTRREAGKMRGVAEERHGFNVPNKAMNHEANIVALPRELPYGGS